MKRLKKLCGAVLIAGFMLPQIALGSTDTAEAASGKWKQDGKKWWYSYSDGTYPKSKWEKISGKWYHFDKSGYMQTGWQKISGKWYYFGTNGIMKTGWQKISGKWYYFAGGVMKTGWLKSGGKWYYFDGSGVMVTGTKTIGGKSYTFGSDGVMKEGSSTESSYANAKVGDIIKFGNYEQDNNLKNGKEAIEWMVLDKKKDGSLFVISKYAIDCQPYNTKRTDVTWEICTLRTWLNSTFLKAAFTSDEMAMILKNTVKNDDNPYYGGKGGNDTKDQVFLLSVDEYEKYKSLETQGDAFPIIKATAYAGARGANTDPSWYEGNCAWWLRSPDNEQGSRAALVFCDDIYWEGSDVDCKWSIRPAMWIQP